MQVVERVIFATISSVRRASKIATDAVRCNHRPIGITGNQQDAEEAVQDAFWNVLRRIDTKTPQRRATDSKDAGTPGPPPSAPPSRTIHGRGNLWRRDGLVSASGGPR
jgi:hypothetical protein